MAFRGERFEVDLDSSDDEAIPVSQKPSLPFVKDILEKEDDQLVTPSPPKSKPTQNGFPEPRVRKGQSKFKREAQRESKSGATSRVKGTAGIEEAEMNRIDEENQKRLQDMSPEEIEQERKELFSGLSGSLIERLLKRSTIDEPHDDFDKPLKEGIKSLPFKADETVPASLKEKKTVSFVGLESSPVAKDKSSNSSNTVSHEELSAEIQSRSIHFPVAQAPSLDPSSSSFLRDLHQKYFPALPYDPQSLSWMAPLSPASNSDYSPSASSFAPAELRFNFSGNLLPPNLAHQIPTTKGLHHHGLAPEAAGYTISELSIYARSTVQAQRCMAFQTLGRFLFKLGNGTFGSDGGPDAEIDEEDAGALLCRGLWGEIRKEHVLDILIDEAEKDENASRHRSAHALAVEAVWLWRRGGGRLPGRIENGEDHGTDIRADGGGG